MAGVITEIAIECGVSEQAVRAWCRRNHVAKDAKGSFAISESQKTAIYQHYLGVERKQVSQPAKASCETCETTLIAMLQGELDRKSEQLAVKDKQIEELNARLAEVSSERFCGVFCRTQPPSAGVQYGAAHGRGNAPSPCRFYPCGNGAVKRTFYKGIYETGIEAAGVCRCRQKADRMGGVDGTGERSSDGDRPAARF